MRGLVLALLLLIGSPSWAAIGVVADNKGSACEIQRNKSKLPGAKGSEIESMDIYSTGACQANITFKDDTKVRVTENSKLLIDDFVFDPKKSDAGKLALKVGMGTVRYTSGQVAKNNPQAVDIKTPSAAIAVRGTDFTMTVAEDGESLIVLVPSCKNQADVKQYELEEQRCKVGKIDVTTLAGTVTLDRAFEATYVTSPNIPPTPPTVLNTIEGKLNNNLILSKPQEIQRAIVTASKSKRDIELEELEAEAQRQITQRLERAPAPPDAKVTTYTYADGSRGCNPTKNICVNWDKPDAIPPGAKGLGVAVKATPYEHYAEIKTQGFVSNTNITIIQNDTLVSEILGDGAFIGNMVVIKQSAGVLRR